MRHCVFGILRTAAGLKIKDEMLKWLLPLYKVECVEQDPPGKEFEYPALKRAFETAVATNEPVLYLHTKGAANTLEVYQSYVRLIWQKLFGNKERHDACFSAFEFEDEPFVLCPYAGKTKATWFNGFIVSPKAASIALTRLLKPNECERHYYEHELFNDPRIHVKGILRNDCDDKKIMSRLIKSKCRG